MQKNIYRNLLFHLNKPKLHVYIHIFVKWVLLSLSLSGVKITLFSTFSDLEEKTEGGWLKGHESRGG